MFITKIYVSLIILIGINALQISDFKDQNVLKYAYDCSKLFEVDLNELKNIEVNDQETFNKYFESSYLHSCFARCIIVRMNLLNQGGKISVVKVYERFPEVDLNIISQVMEKCFEENKQDNNCSQTEATDRCICYRLNKIKDESSNITNNIIE